METTIPLNRLIRSPRNVRTVPASKEQDRQLLALIRKHDILQNLVVTPVPDSSKYYVEAGGRRLEQLNVLAKNKEIKTTHPVPCRVIELDDAVAASLAENQRAPMHPADEFVAYKALADEGKTIKDIAEAFGETQRKIKQRLKLASVSPTLIDHYRSGKMTLEAVMAFTVSDDHEKQEACYLELSPHLQPHQIRRYLLDEALKTDNSLVKLVGLKAYKQAGGAVISDLFQDASYIADVELLESMATQKLEAERDRLIEAGWQWGEVSFDEYGDRGFPAQIKADFDGVPETLESTLAAKQADLDALNEKYYGDWTDEDNALESELETAIEKLENEREQYRNFSDQQKAVSGVVVTLSYSGELLVEYGWVRKEDLATAFPPATSDSNSADTKTSVFVEDAAVESQALMQDLKNFKLQAVQADLLKNDELASDLMLFSIIRRVLGEMGWYDRVLDISVEQLDISGTPGIDETGPALAIEEFSKALDLSWMGFDDEGEKFAAFRTISRAQKKRLMTYCTSMVFTSQGDNTLCDQVLGMMGFELAQHWQPSKANYFNRVRKDDLLNIGQQQLGDQWFDDHAKMKKGQLADVLEASDGMRGWMPQSLL
jgi:ParB family chromosome partitioning protein